MQSNVDILIDRRRNQEAGVLLVIRRKVGSTSSQGYSERGSSDNHDSYGLRVTGYKLQVWVRFAIPNSYRLSLTRPQHHTLSLDRLPHPPRPTGLLSIVCFSTPGRSRSFS